MQLTKDDIFFCYSGRIQRELYNRGVRFIIAGLNVNNHRKFYAYIRTEELSQALAEINQQDMQKGN